MGGGVESWIADHGTSRHTSYNSDCLYNLRPPSPENVMVYIGNGTELVVEYVEKFDLIFHSTQA